MMETARTSETLVNFYQTTRRYNPENSHLLSLQADSLFAFRMSVFRLKQSDFTFAGYYSDGNS
jgi:hypothetical protein